MPWRQAEDALLGQEPDPVGLCLGKLRRLAGTIERGRHAPQDALVVQAFDRLHRAIVADGPAAHVERPVGTLVTGEYTLVECYSRTVLLTSWMTVLVGDPLYNPYAKTPRLRPDQVRPSPAGGRFILLGNP